MQEEQQNQQFRMQPNYRYMTNEIQYKPNQREKSPYVPYKVITRDMTPKGNGMLTLLYVAFSPTWNISATEGHLWLSLHFNTRTSINGHHCS